MSEKSGVNNATATAEVRTAEVPVILLVLVFLALLAATAALVMLWAVTSDLRDVAAELDSSRAALVDASQSAVMAAERADKAERAATLSREYAVNSFHQADLILRESGLRGLKIPLLDHDPVPKEIYDDHDQVESEQ